MEYTNKTKAELITEVMRLRKKIARSEKKIVKPKETKKLLPKLSDFHYKTSRTGVSPVLLG